MPEPKKARDGDAAVTGEDRRTLDDLFSLIYEDLRRLASFARRAEVHATINSTALVHEAWLKLKDSPGLATKSLPHFKSIAAKAMRQVLVDEARRRNAFKRAGGGEASIVTFDDAVEPIVTTDEELLALNEALEQLACLSPRQAQVVESRFFGGLSVAESAELLQVSESVIERDWRTARAWLGSRIRSAKE